MQIHRSLHDYHLADFWKWALAMCIGIIMGLLAFLTDLGIETMNDVKYTTTESRITRGGSAWTMYMSRAHIPYVTMPPRQFFWAIFCVCRHHRRLCVCGRCPGVLCGTPGSWQRHPRDQDLPQRRAHQGLAHHTHAHQQARRRHVYHFCWVGGRQRRAIRARRRHRRGRHWWDGLTHPDKRPPQLEAGQVAVQGAAQVGWLLSQRCRPP